MQKIIKIIPKLYTTSIPNKYTFKSMNKYYYVTSMTTSINRNRYSFSTNNGKQHGQQKQYGSSRKVFGDAQARNNEDKDMHSSRYAPHFHSGPMIETKITEPPKQGYGYYNWQQPSVYTKVIQDRYFLNDLIIGFRHLKQTKPPTYTQSHLTFMSYTASLFPNYQQQILKQLIPAFQIHQQQHGLHNQQCTYIPYLKLLCLDRNKKYFTNKQIKQSLLIIQSYLRRRLMLENNNKTLQSLLNNISFNCFQHMGGLEDLYVIFKKLFKALLKDNQYKINVEDMKVIVQIYQKISLFDFNVKYQKFLAQLPDQLFTNPLYLKNFLSILPDMLSFNFIIFINNRDLEEFNSKLNKCVDFAKDPQIQALLQRYSEHLVLVGKFECINFQDALEPL